MRRDREKGIAAARAQLSDIVETSQPFDILTSDIQHNNIRALYPHFRSGAQENPESLGIGENLRPIKDRIVQSNGEDRKAEAACPRQEFVRRIIQFVLRIIEGVNMKIELDPIRLR